MTAAEESSANYETWSDEQCIRLIREYRARPQLWDRKCKMFHQKALKQKAWEDIGEALKIQPESCRHKMIVLLSSFRREKAKTLNSIGDDGDPSNMYKTTWFAFKELSFLMDKEGEKKRQITKKAYNQPIIDDKISLFPRRSVPAYQYICSPKKKQRSNHSVNDYSDEGNVRETPEIPTEPQPGLVNASDKEDEIKSFTNFIATKMRKYSEATKNEVQRAICEVIFKADANHIELGCDRITVSEHHKSKRKRIIEPIQIVEVKQLANEISDSEFLVEED